jgi:hypothetical protein
MSVQATYKIDPVSASDEDCLITALEELYGKKAVSIAPEGVQVRGYRSKKRPTILISIDGMYGTSGFFKNAAGGYELVYDSMDRKLLEKMFPVKRGKVTHDLFAQAYSKAKVLKALKSMRGRVTQNTMDEEGVAHIRVKTVNYG